MGLAENKPEILIKAKFDHVGFFKKTKLNINIELFSDDSFKYRMNIGPYSMLFINDKAIKIDKIWISKKKQKMYLFKKKKEEQKEAVQDDDDDVMRIMVRRTRNIKLLSNYQNMMQSKNLV